MSRTAEQSVERLKWLVRCGLRPHRFRRIRIGRRRLALDLRNPHERAYAENPATIDAMIARRFVRGGDVVLDAGANIGFTALVYLACGASHVHACEPVRALHRRLRMLCGPDMSAYRVALSDSVREGEVFLSTAHNQGHTLSEAIVRKFPGVFGRANAVERVPVTTIDALLGEADFDFVKIDVEGAEVQALNGARGLFERRPPRVVQVEAYEETSAGVHGILNEVYEHSRRACLQKGSGALRLLDTMDERAAGDASLSARPPMYLYSLEPLED